MNYRRPVLISLALLLILGGCTAPVPETTTPAATLPPGQGPALDRAARALDGLIPEGMTLIQQQQDTLLLRRLAADEGPGALILPELTLTDGEWAGDLIPEALRDSAFMADAAYLAQWGQRLELTRYGQKVTLSDALELLLPVIEGGGYIIDAGAIDRQIQSPLLRKALEMDLVEYRTPTEISEEALLHEELTLYRFQGLIAATVAALEGRVFLKAGRQATLQDAVTLWPLITGLEAAPFTGSNGPMMRLNLALAFKESFARHYSLDQVPDGVGFLAYPDVGDPWTDDMAYVSFYQLMTGYPDYSTFSPDLPVRQDRLPEILNTFYLAYHDGPAARYPAGNQAQANTVYTLPVTYQELVARAAVLWAHYGPLPLPDDPPEGLINLPEYSIYVNQQDGSDYAALNCMPAMVCMALKWRNAASDVTPSELREKYPHVTEGWYMYMVCEQLDAYGVGYYPIEPTRDGLVAALDEGNVVMCQFNAWDVASSGHCLLVVGYRRQGGALWFYVEDPEGQLPGKYGRPANDGLWLEAEELLWSITRFVSDVTVVQSAQNQANTRETDAA